MYEYPYNPYMSPYRNNFMTPSQPQAPNNFNQTPMQPQISILPGRLIKSIDEVTPQEVPMDGSISLFPQNDYSCIYAKFWTKDGNIQTVRFVPDNPPQNSSTQVSLESSLEQINKRFDKIEKMISKNRPYKKPQFPKKEVEDNV